MPCLKSTIAASARMHNTESPSRMMVSTEDSRISFTANVQQTTELIAKKTKDGMAV